jgi:hypothetical protein
MIERVLARAAATEDLNPRKRLNFLSNLWHTRLS